MSEQVFGFDAQRDPTFPIGIWDSRHVMERYRHLSALPITPASYLRNANVTYAMRRKAPDKDGTGSRGARRMRAAPTGRKGRGHPKSKYVHCSATWNPSDR